MRKQLVRQNADLSQYKQQTNLITTKRVAAICGIFHIFSRLNLERWRLWKDAC